MPKMNVSQSITIEKSIDEVFAKISDFAQWEGWSPWSILEKGIKTTYAENNKFYEWVGDITGAGTMKITSETKNESVNIDLTFLKPFKSKAKVDFQLSKDGEATKVVWNMQSSMPFFLFFMVKAMRVYIGLDFHRGLLLLKDLLETGDANCKLEIIGENKFKGSNYIGIPRQMADISRAPEAMKTDFTNLMEYARSKENLISGNTMCLYNEWNLVKNTGDYIAMVQVASIPADLPKGFVSGSLPESKMYGVRMTGPYHHLGNPWTAIEMHARTKKFKKQKSKKPLEIYINNPMDTVPNDLITEIHFPMI